MNRGVFGVELRGFSVLNLGVFLVKLRDFWAEKEWPLSLELMCIIERGCKTEGTHSIYRFVDQRLFHNYSVPYIVEMNWPNQEFHIFL